MKHVEPIINAIGGVLWSKDKKNKPLSLLLVAKPGHGKSDLLLSIYGYDVVVLTKVTGAGLYDLMKDENPPRYIVIPDFLIILGMSKSTSPVRDFLSFIEEGSYGKKTASKKHTAIADEDKPFTFSILTGMTNSAYEEREREFENTGFSSRVITLFYNYTKSEFEDIKREIAKNPDRDTNKVKIEAPHPDQLIDKHRNDTVVDFIYELSKLFDDNFRYYRNFNLFIDGISRYLRPDDPDVTLEDVVEAFSILTYSTNTRTPGNKLRYLLMKQFFFEEFGIGKDLTREINFYSDSEIEEEMMFIRPIADEIMKYAVGTTSVLTEIRERRLSKLEREEDEGGISLE